MATAAELTVLTTEQGKLLAALSTLTAELKGKVSVLESRDPLQGLAAIAASLPEYLINISVSGGTAGSPLPGTGGSTGTPVPAPVETTISRFVAGEIVDAPYLTSQWGSRYEFDPATAALDGKGAGITVNGVAVPWVVSMMRLGADGAVYCFTTDGFWRRFTNTDIIYSGSTVGAPPLAAPGAPAGGGTGGTAGPVNTADPVPASPAPGASGRTINATPGTLAATVAGAAAGDTIKAAPGVYNESVGNGVALEISGGGKVINPGEKGATYSASAVLDAEGADPYKEGQGGFVLLADAFLRGWEVRGFGAKAGGHDGTGGVRNNRGGTFRLEDCYLHHNQMGIGPHAGDPNPSLMRVKNCLFLNNGLPGDPGYAHNIYSYATHLIIEGGVTSIAEQGSGDGHPLKFGGPVLEIYGKNYFRGVNTSCIDIPHGTAKPFVIKSDAAGGTVVEKLAGDENTVIFGYGPETQNNGNAGGMIEGATFIIPNDGREFIFLTSGTIMLANCKFLYTDGSPVKPGAFVVQGNGAVTGLPA